MTRPYDTLVFDWDGTLIDSIGWIVQCLQHAARETGLAVPGDAQARDVIGLSLGNAFATLFPEATHSERGALVQVYRELYLSRATGPDDLFPGVAAMLETLDARGFKLAIATGKATDGLRRALHGTGIGSLFAATRCAEQTSSKPDPRMLRELMADLNTVPTRTLMIGDSIHDLQMARNAGVPSAAVTCGAHRAEHLLPFEPRWCLTQTTELLDLLDEAP